MREVAIMVAPNGARRTKSDHPRLPVTPAELAETARACMAAGAGAIHLHVREEDQRHSLDPRHYAEAMAAVGAACGEGFPIQITSEAGGIYEAEEQMQAMRSMWPTRFSLAPREILRAGRQAAATFVADARNAGCDVQYILYDDDDATALSDLAVACGLTAMRLLLVLGRYVEEVVPAPAEVARRLRAAEAAGLDVTDFMVCAFGTAELACLREAVRLGGHVRIGFENALTDETGRLAYDNAERVAAAAKMILREGHRPADAAATRRVLGETLSESGRITAVRPGSEQR